MHSGLIREDVGAVLTAPWLEGSSVVVRRHHHPANTLARCGVALPIRVGTVVEANLLIANLAIVSWYTHAPTDGVFYRAPAVKGAVAFAVFDAAIIPDEWWGALDCPETVAYAITLSPVLPSAGLLISVLYIDVQVSVLISCLASVSAVGLLCDLIVVAEGPWAGDIGAVVAVVAYVAEAEPKEAVSMPSTVIDAVGEMVVPHVRQHLRVPSVAQGQGLLLFISQASVDDDFA